MQVIRREGEDFEAFLRRYKRDFAASGIMRDEKRTRFFMSAGDIRKKKAADAARRARKKRPS